MSSIGKKRQWNAFHSTLAHVHLFKIEVGWPKLKPLTLKSHWIHLIINGAAVNKKEVSHPFHFTSIMKTPSRVLPSIWSKEFRCSDGLTRSERARSFSAALPHLLKTGDASPVVFALSPILSLAVAWIARILLFRGPGVPEPTLNARAACSNCDWLPPPT